MSAAASSSAAAARPRVNLRSSAVKRIMQEATELADPDTDDFVAAPLESDIFEWHCTLRGVAGTDYEGGLYHLRIILPASYPMSAPDIVLLTPNGRFELGKKICIDGLTSFHAGSWQPAWGVRTAITGLRAFWTQDGEALSAIGALDYPKEERRRLAKASREWTCPTCKEQNIALLPDAPPKAKDEAAPQSPVAGVAAVCSGAQLHSQAEPAATTLPPVQEDATVTPTPTVTAPPPAAPAQAVDAAAQRNGVPPTTAMPVPAPAAPLPVITPAPAAVVTAGPPPPAPGARPALPAPAPRTAPPPAITPAPAAAPMRVPQGSPIPPGLAAIGGVRPTPTRTRVRTTPLWLDALIALLVAILMAMLLKG